MAHNFADAMKYLCATVVVVDLWAFSAWAGIGGIVVVPIGLNPGEQYRLAFVTSTTRDALATDIADYNTFVTDAANGQPLLAALATTWTAIASTATVDARDNSLTNPSSAGVPIYRLDGLKVADGNPDLWDGSYPDNSIAITEFAGSTPLSTPAMGVERPWVWTGSTAGGVKSTGYLGVGNESTAAGVAYEGPQFNAAEWIGLAGFAGTNQLPLYGISGVLTVPPPDLLGDYNVNGAVDAADYVVWRSNPAELPNEGASPGVVDQADYNFWRERFGATSGAGAGGGLTRAAVPEPEFVMLIAIGCIVATFLRCRSSASPPQATAARTPRSLEAAQGDIAAVGRYVDSGSDSPGT